MSLMSIKRFPHFPMFRKIFILRNRLYLKNNVYPLVGKPYPDLVYLLDSKLSHIKAEILQLICYIYNFFR